MNLREIGIEGQGVFYLCCYGGRICSEVIGVGQACLSCDGSGGSLDGSEGAGSRPPGVSGCVHINPFVMHESLQGMGTIVRDSARVGNDEIKL